MPSTAPDTGPAPQLSPDLRVRLEALQEEGRQLWDDFDAEVRQEAFHPFVPSDYERVLPALLALRAPGARFLEWGAAMGVITIMADLLGFQACGIEIDAELVAVARDLAARYSSRARFAVGSFLPSGYRWRPADGDGRPGTIGEAESAYLELGCSLVDFDVVFVYPWTGEEPMIHDLMGRYGNPEAHLLIFGLAEGVTVYRAGRRVG